MPQVENGYLLEHPGGRLYLEPHGFLPADLEAGALGLSTGLEYDPGIYSDTDEVITLARDDSDLD